MRLPHTQTRRGEATYEEVRRAIVWNARVPARHPDVIVTPADELEVVEAVRRAREEGLRIAVKSGGHSWVGASLRDGGMLIDLARLDAYSIDGQAAAVAVQPAVAVRELANALAAAGLGFPTGHCPSVCVGGYLLAGGWGWNSPAWGPACHRVEAIDVVTAAGELVRADAREHADLLWAARGGGAGFPGVVTRFHLRAFPLPPVIATCEHVFELDDLPQVVGWLAATLDEVPRCVKAGMKLFWPADDAEAPVLGLGAAAFAASSEEAEAALGFFDACPVAGSAISATRCPRSSYAELYRETGAAYPERGRYAADTLWSNADPVDLIARLAERVARAPSRRSFVTLALSSGVLPPAPDPGAALSMVGRLFVGCYALWEAAADDEVNVAWTDELMRSFEPEIAGHYLGEMDLWRWHAARAYAPESWDRLQRVRARRDPDGLFHGFPAPAAGAA